MSACGSLYQLAWAMASAEPALLELANAGDSETDRLILAGMPRPEAPPWRSPKAAIPLSLRRSAFERDAYRCRACGSWIDLTIDHIVPEREGGPTTLANVQTLCRPCNSRKGIR